MLLVEPVELLGIEHRVAAADALEIERRRRARRARTAPDRSLPGDQPSSARKFIIASGRYPCRAYSVTEVAPCRLLKRFLSGPRMSGTCANARNRRVERAIQQDLLRRVRNVIVAPNHVRDSHLDIVATRRRADRSAGRRSEAGRSPRCARRRTRSGRGRDRRTA